MSERHKLHACEKPSVSNVSKQCKLAPEMQAETYPAANYGIKPVLSGCVFVLQKQIGGSDHYQYITNPEAQGEAGWSKDINSAMLFKLQVELQTVMEGPEVGHQRLSTFWEPELPFEKIRDTGVILVPVSLHLK